MIPWLLAACAAPEPYPTVPSPWHPTGPRCDTAPASDVALEEPEPGATLGYPTTVGDFDGDGVGDLAVGLRDPEDYLHGGFRVLRGPAYDTPWFEAWGGDGERLGETLLAMGDVTGDGRDDLVATAATMGDDEFDRGVLRLYTGGPDGLVASTEWPAGDDAPLGFDLAAADTDGDGVRDLVVGSRLERITVFPSGPDGPSTTGVPLPPLPDARWFGPEVWAVGDVDGDGKEDVLTLGDGPEPGSTDDFYVFPGNGGTPTWIPGVGDVWGVAGGDLDGDGHSDVVLTTRGGDLAGRVWWFRGGPLGLEGLATGRWDGAKGDQQTGVAVLPDLDGDGDDELVVGSRGATVDGAEYAGRIALWPGTPAGPGPASVTFDGTGARCFVGDTLGAGRVNADPVADLVVPLYGEGVRVLYGARSWTE